MLEGMGLSAPGNSRRTGGRDSSKPKLCNEDAMTKRSEAKYKIDRRMGQNIWGRPKSPVNKREYGPGQHGQRRKGKLSDFGVQLRAKQKLKGYYANISERQFHAHLCRGHPAEGRLRREPDRPARAPSRHRGLSRQVRRHDVCRAPVRQSRPRQGERPPRQYRRATRSRSATSSRSRNPRSSSRSCSKPTNSAERDMPDFLEVDHGKHDRKFVRVPALSEVPFAVQMEPHLIVEFYSR